MALRRILLAALLGLAVAVSAAPAFADTPNYDTEMRALTRAPKVRAAFRAFERGERQDIADLITLTEIPAPPFGEQVRGARFADMLRAAGLTDVSIDEVGNVIGRRPGRGGGPALAFIAHLDTVFPEGTDVKVRRDGDTYHAPGVADDSRGLAYMLGMVRGLASARIETQGDLLFVGSVGEEGLGDLRGVKHLFREGGPRIDAALAIDGAEAGRIVHAAVGSLRYRITVNGAGGHSWSDFGAANPHHALARIIARFDDSASQITLPPTRASFSVGRIGGGTSVNSIPFESWMEVDMRAIDPAKLAELDAALQDAVTIGLGEENDARRRGAALTVKVDRVGERPAGAQAETTPLVQRAMAAMRRLDIAPLLGESSTDANVPIARGIPAITLSGGGAAGGAHSPQEWWRADDPHVALQVGLLIALAEVGLVR